MTNTEIKTDQQPKAPKQTNTQLEKTFAAYASWQKFQEMLRIAGSLVWQNRTTTWVDPDAAHVGTLTKDMTEVPRAFQEDTKG